MEAFWQAFTWLLPVQAHLVDECLARFYGPARPLWYLSDGGHFDNTAVYELIRRRIPLIIVCDDGADPDYSWQDLGGLVRKVRIDFGAEVRFLEREELRARVAEDLHDVIAPWHEFRRFDRTDGSRPKAALGTDESPRRPYAALAEVTYDGSTARTTILLIKPNIRGDESADILTYWADHPDFPPGDDARPVLRRGTVGTLPPSRRGRWRPSLRARFRHRVEAESPSSAAVTHIPREVANNRASRNPAARRVQATRGARKVTRGGSQC